eukprot:6558620-Alexandrium_andersonii.AAC.1
MQTRFRRSELELRGPRNGLGIGPRSSRGVHSEQLFAQIRNLPTRAWIEWSEVANSQAAGSNPQSSNPQCAQSFAIGAREP